MRDGGTNKLFFLDKFFEVRMNEYNVVYKEKEARKLRKRHILKTN